ncbi:apolipoprotein N-acyltransferase [Candidatus Blochmanniella vafra str. BVAF]|uniref:Apolipoprotein N-acyltransferase n=1 Tax=Blochmanniella vafra (strain BVAF) TaxID=859654 RepID=E8Q6W7_BLOVB|nr:apolipoprotein N-acyltransferase [Candidatus Blochmannia vafer]ADV33714.1 apolipoprotein N-acyltransferase [Candidatus Blochmannia vafer str. BVAF]
MSILNFQYKHIQLVLALILGMFGILAFSPYDFWPASIISLTGLFTIILDVSWTKAVRNTFLWGLGFFGSGLYWVYIGISQYFNVNTVISFLLIFILIIYLTLFPMLFSILFVILQTITTKWISLVIATATLWSIIERLRGYICTGFPWLQFGYTQIDGPMKGIAPILGVEGITFILVFISALLALSIKTIQLFPFFLFLMTLMFLYPLTWIQWYHLDPKRITTISLVQGNIDQHLEYNAHNIALVLQTYLKHTLPLIGKSKIIIWPESAILGHELFHNKFLTLLDHQLKKSNTCLITGIINRKFDTKKNKYYHYNSIIVLGDTIPYTYENHNRYNKHHLVLCAEKFPLQTFFEPLFQYLKIPIVFMKSGCYLQPQLNAINVKITAAICYEIILGNQIRDNFKFNSDFLLVIANDAWFGCSIGPWQHFQMIRMRAIELGRPILCCTNNGVTAIILADGSIEAQVSQFISTTLTEKVIPTTGLTPYARFGTWWLFIIIVIIYTTYSILFIKNMFFKKF